MHDYRRQHQSRIETAAVFAQKKCLVLSDRLAAADLRHYYFVFVTKLRRQE